MPSNFKRPPLPLLHIDDDPDDRFLIQEAIRATGNRFEVHEADGVQAAVDYFRQSAREHFPLPLRPDRPLAHPRLALVLLDYDLGAQCGTDFLYWLRSLHRNTALPVVMYSGSAGEGHIGECYAHGANYFLRKAQTFLALQTVVRALHVCFSRPNPCFGYLARLPESEPNPRVGAGALA